jgi:hypothetical protein
MSWKPLGAVAPGTLSDARKRMHRSVQWLARIARSYLPATPDDSHTALVWVDAPVSSLADDEAEASPHIALAANLPVRYEIVATSLTARYAPLLHQLWLGNPARPNNVFNLTDRADAEMAADLPRALASLGAEGEGFRADDLPYVDEIPLVPDLAAPEVSAAAELCRYYSNVSNVLAALATPGRLSPVCLWPHHFDLARQINLEGGGSIKVGLAPDDAAYGQPHLYVAPWPCRETHSLPAAPAGMHWRRQGFTALVATAEDVMLGVGAEARVAAAIENGIGLCEKMLS